MALDRGDFRRLERVRPLLRQRSEGAVTLVAPGAARGSGSAAVTGGAGWQAASAAVAARKRRRVTPAISSPAIPALGRADRAGARAGGKDEAGGRRPGFGEGLRHG